jgi:hypothetical protein
LSIYWMEELFLIDNGQLRIDIEKL